MSIAIDLAAAGFSREADVLVIGGGPAGAWAACSAAATGAKVVLVDKGCCGTSGATASAGTGVWYVPPEPAKRLAAMESREKLGGYLQDRGWMTRVLDRTFESVISWRNGAIRFRRMTTVRSGATTCAAPTI